jgi:hypothetical protein
VDATVSTDFVVDINNSDAPLGPGIGRADGLINAPTEGRNQAVAVTEAGAVHLAQIFLEGEVRVGDGPALELSGVNTFRLPADGIGLFTPLWGEYTRAESVAGAEETAEVTIVNGIVADVSDNVGSGAIDEDTLVLVGGDAGAKALLDLEVGEQVDVRYAPRSDVGEIAAAVGGSHVLVRDGVPQSFTDAAVHPRTAVGISEDGSEVFLVVVDGRQAHARGMSLTELGEFMHGLGAHEALNVDGGGSSTLVARLPGVRVRCGVSTVHSGAIGLRAAAAEARTAAATVRATEHGRGVRRFDPHGLTRTLVEWYASDTAQQAVRSVLAPLDQLGAKRRTEAIRTLLAYLEHQGSVARAAELLHLHRNTVRYRLDRIFGLLDVDPDDPDDRLMLLLACRASMLA